MLRILRITYFIVLVFAISGMYGFEVFIADSKVKSFNIDKLDKSELVSFQTIRHKDDTVLIENWQGLQFHNWLKKNDLTNYQSIRFESYDNYMVRIHKAELDTMVAFIAIRKENADLDSTEVRIIFPYQRDMLWVRGISQIFLEDFDPFPSPAQIFIWESIVTKFTKVESLEPFVDMSGFYLEPIMHDFFRQDEGSVVIVCRDGLKSRLDYPRHLKGAILEETQNGVINLKSPSIPAGMWLKDIVYLQAGPYAIIRQDFLYRLPSLYKTLEWSSLIPSEQVIRVNSSKSTVPLESLYFQDTIPLTANDWIELP